MAACLFGKQVMKDIYKLDVPLLLTNSNDEIESITKTIFQIANRKDWVLLIDSVEYLFNKKTSLDQQAKTSLPSMLASLLFEIECFQGIIIFETNTIENLENTFLQKLRSTIKFEIPNNAERSQLWINNIPLLFTLDWGVNLEEIAENYILTGAQIVSLIENICIKVLARKDHCITNNDIQIVLKKANIKVNQKNVPEVNSKKVIKIFISYSSKDRKMRDLLLEGLKAHLAHKEGIAYIFWEDRQIDIGADWKEDIEQALMTSQAAILLISANFAASAFIQENELKTFLKKQADEGYLIFPVLVRNYVFKDFKELSGLNFFKTYYDEYGFTDAKVRDELLPFDVLGDEATTTDKKFQDYYRKLSDHIHKAILNNFK
jgi:hypothetical protein